METRTSVIIKSLREGMDLSRKQYAEQAGIPLRTMGDWEAGKRNPPAYVLNLIEFWVKHGKPYISKE